MAEKVLVKGNEAIAEAGNHGRLPVTFSVIPSLRRRK